MEYFENAFELTLNDVKNADRYSFREMTTYNILSTFFGPGYFLLQLSNCMLLAGVTPVKAIRVGVAF